MVNSFVGTHEISILLKDVPHHIIMYKFADVIEPGTSEYTMYVISGSVLLRIMDYSRPLIVCCSMIGLSHRVIVATTMLCS